MIDIMMVFACLGQRLSATELRQLTRVAQALLSMSGRVTMRGISRWAGQGGSYRTVQRFFNTALDWSQLQRLLIRTHLLDDGDDEVMLVSGDHVVVTKAGQHTHGLDRFFSSLYGKSVRGLCFLSLSLISVKHRKSYSVLMEQVGMHLVSKLRHNSALYFRYEGPYSGRGPHRKYGEKLDYQQIPETYLKACVIEKAIETKTYQMQLWHKKFADLLNVVVIVKTNLKTQAQAHVVLFSSDLALGYAELIDYYRLRFQIEFNFRDAKQYWGLEDFMSVNERPVYNSANLAMFMVNVPQVLIRQMRPNWPEFSVNDLKAWWRGKTYVVETLKCLPEMPEAIFIDQIIAQVAELGRINHVETAT